MGWLGYVILFLVFILLLYLYIGLQIAMLIVVPKVKSINETLLEEATRDASLIPFLKDNQSKEYNILSQYKYPLHVYEMVKDKDNKKFVVLVHGYTYSHHGVIKYAKMMISLGFNVILYDHRNHGLSGGKNTTLGFYEHHDLKTVIDHVYKSYGDDILLGTYGESMGSATVLLEQEIDKRVKFLVSDAGFKDLKTLVKRQIKAKKLWPWIFYGITNLFVWLISKANLSKVSPIQSIKDSTIPILFVHGKLDKFIPYSHTVDMYESYKGDKMLYLADKDAYHARSYYSNKEAYFNVVKDFIETYVIK